MPRTTVATVSAHLAAAIERVALLEAKVAGLEAQLAAAPSKPKRSAKPQRAGSTRVLRLADRTVKYVPLGNGQVRAESWRAQNPSFPGRLTLMNQQVMSVEQAQESHDRLAAQAARAQAAALAAA